MGPRYSAEGVDIHVSDGIMLIRNDGVRRQGTERDTGRLVERMLAHGDVRGVLNDARDAEYPLDQLEFEMRSRYMARVLGARFIALVVRPPNDAFADILIKACRQHGGVGRIFRSTTEGRAWLETEIARERAAEAE